MRSRYAVPENGPVVETLRSERAAGGRPIVFHDIEYAAALLDPNLRGPAPVFPSRSASLGGYPRDRQAIRC